MDGFLEDKPVGRSVGLGAGNSELDAININWEGKFREVSVQIYGMELFMEGILFRKNRKCVDF